MALRERESSTMQSTTTTNSTTEPVEDHGRVVLPRKFRDAILEPKLKPYVRHTCTRTPYVYPYAIRMDVRHPYGRTPSVWTYAKRMNVRHTCTRTPYVYTYAIRMDWLLGGTAWKWRPIWHRLTMKVEWFEFWCEMTQKMIEEGRLWILPVPSIFMLKKGRNDWKI